MRAAFTNFGTRGDFEPLLALADEFSIHGHEVIFAAPEFAVPMIRARGFHCVVIASNVAALRDKVNLLWASQSDAYFHGEPLLEMLSPLRSLLPLCLRGLVEACSGAAVLISGPAQPLARVVFETTGIPFVSVQLSHFGGNGGPALSRVGDEIVNTFRRNLGLPQVSDPFTHGANSPQLALYAMSSHLRSKPAGWPCHFHVTGYFFPPRPRTPSDDLVKFMERGARPIVITFGSMPHENYSELRAIIIEAVAQSGFRAVILGLEKGPEAPSNDTQLYWAESAPYDWLFPKSACVVTHGGAGTAAEVFRSGVAGIFVPHGDISAQRYWAQLARELGCAVSAIPYPELEAGRLSRAIRESVSSPELRQAASQLGAKVRSERGVQNARRLIERLIEQIGLESLN